MSSAVLYNQLNMKRKLKKYKQKINKQKKKIKKLKKKKKELSDNHLALTQI